MTIGNNGPDCEGPAGKSQRGMSIEEAYQVCGATPQKILFDEDGAMWIGRCEVKLCGGGKVIPVIHWHGPYSVSAADTDLPEITGPLQFTEELSAG